MRIVKHIYYDVYYNIDDPKEVKKAKSLQNNLEKRGFSLEVEDAHVGSTVCDQYLFTQALKDR